MVEPAKPVKAITEWDPNCWRRSHAVFALHRTQAIYRENKDRKSRQAYQGYPPETGYPVPVLELRNIRRGQPEEPRPGTPPPASEVEGPTVATPAIGITFARPSYVDDHPATDPPADDTPTPSAPESQTLEVTRPEPPKSASRGRRPTQE